MDKESIQLSFDEEKSQTDNGPVICLGMTFKNDDERKEYFREELRKKLPELKKIEGFPIGEDEDIIALSDPPYYTACPNPWINDFIEEWEKENNVIRVKQKNSFNREPFTSDVSEGKSDPIYMAHAYHTKVPYKAIMRYILHYTEPGEIVFDGFSGSGMTGIAASMCGDKTIVEELGVSNEIKVGKRNVILNDISIAATHISNNYNNTLYIVDFQKKFQDLLNEVQSKFEWMYETNHIDGSKGQINYVVWSEVFICPHCGNEFSYWDVAIDLENKKVKEQFHCNNCFSVLKKNDIDRVMETKYHNDLESVYEQAKFIPVLINYSKGNKRYEKYPDEKDLLIFKKVEEYSNSNSYPKNEIISGDEVDLRH